jgi:hypothetical protein
VRREPMENGNLRTVEVSQALTRLPKCSVRYCAAEGVLVGSQRGLTGRRGG